MLKKCMETTSLNPSITFKFIVFADEKICPIIYVVTLLLTSCYGHFVNLLYTYRTCDTNMFETYNDVWRN